MANWRCEIGNRKPVNAGWPETFPRMAGLKLPVSHFPFVIMLLVAGALSVAGAQPNSAVVTGAQHVFIRRGPGTEFPPFATLVEGSTVEIQEMRGEWTRVLTASGQSGYVNSTFLALPSERRGRPAATVGAPARSAAAAATPARPQAAAVSALTEENKNLTAQVHQLQEELAALKAQAEVTPPAASPTAAPPAVDLDKLHDELAHLGAAVEQLNKRLEIEPPRVNVAPLSDLPVDGHGRVVTSTAILLAAIGLCVGWLVGNAFGRRQERGRRPRVRL